MHLHDLTSSKEWAGLVQNERINTLRAVQKSFFALQDRISYDVVFMSGNFSLVGEGGVGRGVGGGVRACLHLFVS